MAVTENKKILVYLFRLHSFFLSFVLQAMPLGTAEESKTIHHERRWQAREIAERTAKMRADFISDCSVTGFSLGKPLTYAQMYSNDNFVFKTASFLQNLNSLAVRFKTDFDFCTQYRLLRYSAVWCFI